MINARNTDPLSSHLAGQDIDNSGIAGTQRQLALKAVRAHQGYTSKELASTTNLDRYMLARRLPELRSVRKGKDRICRISKRLSVTWVLK